MTTNRLLVLGNELENAVDSALVQIVSDVNSGDLSGIEELLRYVPLEVLKGFVSEENLDIELDSVSNINE